jgi:hypothetical protein
MTIQQANIQLEPATEMRITVVNYVVWCNINDPETNIPHQVPGHPFPDTDPDMQHFTQTRKVQVNTGNSYGTPTYQDRTEVTTEIYMCGYHWRKQNPFQSNADEDKPILSQVEEKTEEYLRGYHDAYGEKAA